MKFKALIMNNFDDFVEIVEIKAKNEEEAYENADEMQHNQEFYIIFNGRRWNNLKKMVRDK